MAFRQGLKPKKPSQRALASNNSPTSSTTSSSRQFPEPSIDGLSSPASSSARSKPQYFYSESVVDVESCKENVTVTVRFRPLRYTNESIFVIFALSSMICCGLFLSFYLCSPREIRQGEEIAWYADGETIVRNEHDPSIAYAYGKF